MGTKKTHLLVRELVYWVTMNDDIKQTMRHCSMCVEYQHRPLHEAAIDYDTPCKLWVIVGTDVFMIINKKHLQ